MNRQKILDCQYHQTSVLYQGKEVYISVVSMPWQKEERY